MRKQYGVIFAVIGYIVFFFCVEGWGADWKLYDISSDTGCRCYYDAQSITRPSKNIVRVWTRNDYTEKDVLEWVTKNGRRYENLSHSRYLWEINCPEKKFCFRSLTYYDKEGGAIDTTSSLPTRWDFIIPESVSESLYKEVCK